MPEESMGSQHISNGELNATLKTLIESETELNHIIADFSEHPDTHTNFGPVEYYTESLDNVRIIIKLIQMRLNVTYDAPGAAPVAG